MDHNFIQPPEGMRVTVLVPTFNRANYISECLDSLLAQTMPALEIIVIDDGSEDGTYELLRDYGMRIRYIRKENGGKPTAVNLGLTLARGELIWIFDDDDVALPTAIEDRVKVLQQFPEAGFVYAAHFYGTDSTCGKIQQGRQHKLPLHNSDVIFFELMKSCFFSLSSSLIKKSSFEKIGDFDIELLSSEDYDIAIRLAFSYPVAVCYKPVFIVREHAGLRGAKSIRYKENERAKVFSNFDARIGEKLWSQVEIGNYLTPRKFVPSNSEAYCEALLNRMTVMASKGCIVKMMTDLKDYLELKNENYLIKENEKEKITQVICTGYAASSISNQWFLFRKLVDDLPKSKTGLIAKRALALGFFRLGKSYPGSFLVRAKRIFQSILIAKTTIF